VVKKLKIDLAAAFTIQPAPSFRLQDAHSITHTRRQWRAEQTEVVFFMHVGSRKVQVAGVTPHPDQVWMMQMSRHVTMEEWGFLVPGQYVALMPAADHGQQRDGPIRCRERLGGLLYFYDRQAA
jgi:hypothetical protein